MERKRPALLGHEDNSPLAMVRQAVDLLNLVAQQLECHLVNIDASADVNQTPILTGTSLDTLERHVRHNSKTPSLTSPCLTRSSSCAVDGEETLLLKRWLRSDAGRVHASYRQCLESKKRELASSFSGNLSLLRTPNRVYSWWTVHPQSKQRCLWDSLSVIFIAWDLFVIPLHAFDLTALGDMLVTVDLYITIFWTLDVIMSFRTGFYKRQSVEMNPKQIASYYAKTWMSVDVVIVSLEWMACLTDTAGGANAARFQRLRLVARYIRGMRSGKLYRTTAKMKAGMRSFHLLLGFSIMQKIALLIGICHYLTCGWYFVGRSSSDGWVFAEPVAGNALYDLVFSYVSASRWTLAQINGRTDLADDRNMQERAYTCLCALFTVVFHSLFISAITTRMVQLMDIVTDAQKGMRVLNSYLDRHTLSYGTVYFAREYVRKYQFIKNELKIEKELLEYLPDHLQCDLVYEVRSPTLVPHPFMGDLNTNFKAAFRQLVEKAISTLYARKNELVFEPDIPCDRVLFHEQGQLRFTAEDNFQKNTLSKRYTQWAMESSTPKRSLQRSVTSVRTLGMASPEDEFDFGDEAQDVPRGRCLSEAAFWIKWKHRGALMSIAESHLLAVDIGVFFKVLDLHADAEARAAVYALSFVEKMKHVDVDEVLDLLEDDFGAVPDDLDFFKGLCPHSIAIYSDVVSERTNSMEKEDGALEIATKQWTL